MPLVRLARHGNFPDLLASVTPFCAARSATLLMTSIVWMAEDSLGCYFQFYIHERLHQMQ